MISDGQKSLKNISHARIKYKEIGIYREKGHKY